MKPATTAADATKGERTRARIAEAAFALFAEKGYEATSMRDIAARAGCAVGLLYRYFPRRESFALALYREMSAEVLARTASLPDGTLAARFATVMRARVAVAKKHREVLRALAGAGLDRRSETGVLGKGTADIRAATEARLLEVVRGASDAPKPPLDAAVARLLFFAELVVVLALTQDESRGARKTLALVDSVEKLLAGAAPFAMLAAPQLLELDALATSFEES